jgi:hypothetical protein
MGGKDSKNTQKPNYFGFSELEFKKLEDLFNTLAKIK